MGVIGDLLRLFRVVDRLPPRPSMREAIRLSADAAEQWAPLTAEFAAGAQGAAGAYGATVANPFENMAFAAQGLRAAGTVVSLAPTGSSFEELPVYTVHLDVRIDGREPYRATYSTVIAAGALHNWQPGAVLPFRVSPGDPQSLMLG